MKLTAQAIKNPVAIAIGVIFIVFLGVVSLFKLPVQLFPEIERPRISIQTNWRSASPLEVESEIVEPQEQILRGIPGLASLNAFVNRGNAFINLEFGVDTNMEQTLIEVISRMTRLPPLPADATPPRIMLGGFGGGGPALTWFFLQALPENDQSIYEYFDYVNSTIRPRLERIPGVSGVQTFDNNNAEEIQIKFDPVKAIEYGIQIPQLVNAVTLSNDVTGGFVDVGKRQYTLRFSGKYPIEQLSELTLSTADGSRVRLGEIAVIERYRNDRFNRAIQNGNPAFSIRIDKASGANVLATLERVKAEVDDINAEILADKQLVMVQSFDASVFIYRAISLVTNNLFAGVVLSLFVLWLFIRKSRPTLIIAIAIPISLLVTFVVLNALGRSLNVISLAGLAFAVGMVLDAAIVVLENILRLRENGQNNSDSAVKGTAQVWGAMLASTTTTVAIFLPVFFLDGVEGQLFGDLALTIAIAVSVSLVVAVILLPVLANLWIKDKQMDDKLAHRWKKITASVMRWTATNRKRMGLAFSLMFIPVAISYIAIPTLDYLPPVKRDAVDANLRFPPGANMETIKKEVVDPIVARLKPHMDGVKQPYLKNYYIFYGPGGGGMGIRALDQSRVNELLDVVLNEVLVDLPDTTAFASQGNLFGGFNGGRSVSMHLQSRDDRALLDVAKQGIQWIETAIPGAQVQASPGLDLAEPELRLTPNDQEIFDQGWSRRDLSTVVRTLGDGLYVGEHFDGSKRINMILRAEGWNDPDNLGDVPVVTAAGNITQLSQLVDINRTVGPSNLRRINGERTVTLDIVPPDGWSLEQSIAKLSTDVEPKLSAALPADGVILYGSNVSQLQSTITVMGQNFAFALLILFLLLAALFRSAKDSLLVLVTVPLATVGGVLALQILNRFVFQPLDLLTMIGFVILLGLVVNNAILLVHHTRLAEAAGQVRRAAVEQALRLRLRPIFMSTLTSFFGMLPLLLIPGEGSVIYRGLAAVIVGGLGVSTLFTIVLLPCLLQMSKNDFHLLNPIKNIEREKQLTSASADQYREAL
ncbi:MAG: efflux RND transporter permease subunit [Marinicella sp.]